MSQYPQRQQDHDGDDGKLAAYARQRDWIKRCGDGRVFYCSLGHRKEIYWNKAVLAHYLAGIQWALGDLPADETPSAKLATQPKAALAPE